MSIDHASCSTIVTLDIKQKIQNKESKSQINFVQFPGSQKIAKSGAVKEVVKEVVNVSKTLGTFSRVIDQLLKERNKYVPYRDCILTQFIQDKFCKNTRTAIIFTLYPQDIRCSENLTTVELAQKCQNLKITPKINC